MNDAAGLHFGMPWRQVSNLVTKQNVVFDLPVKGCLTRDNVTVEIDVAIVFRIMGDASRVMNGRDGGHNRFCRAVEPRNVITSPW